MFLNHNVSRDGSSLVLQWVRSMELACIGGPLIEEEPSLETMEKVQKIDRSNTAPSSKTFRYES
jgi:hypothetical protein